MKITLYRAFPDIYRQSMTLYTDQLMKALRSQVSKDDTLQDFIPDSISLTPALARYFSQYFIYQVAAKKAAGDINHITDHSYAHLVHSLPSHKTVVTFHDAIWLKEKSRWGRNISKAHNLRGLEKAGFIICDSESSRQELLKRVDYSEKKTRVIYPGIDPLFFENPPDDIKNNFNLNPGLHLLHVGHTGDYKNIPALFHVLSLLRKRGVEISLLKTGTSFTPQQWDIAKKLGVAPHINHLGLVRREALPQIYRSAHVLLHPSLDEGFGFPVLESMACGLPVVTSNRGSLPELIADPKQSCPAEDYNQMANKVQEILENTSLKNELIEKGKIKMAAFQWQKTAAQVFEVYQSLHRKTREL